MLFEQILGFKDIDEARISREQLQQFFDIVEAQVEEERITELFQSFIRGDKNTIKVSDFAYEAEKHEGGQKSKSQKEQAIKN